VTAASPGYWGPAPLSARSAVSAHQFALREDTIELPKIRPTQGPLAGCGGMWLLLGDVDEEPDPGDDEMDSPVPHLRCGWRCAPDSPNILS